MTDEQARTLLRAAERLLEAREDQMVTIQEWEALEAAVAACRSAS